MKEKKARVIYDKGDPKQKGTIAEEEGFYVETWDEEFGWEVVCKTVCRKSLDYPDEKEKNSFTGKRLRPCASYLSKVILSA